MCQPSDILIWFFAWMKSSHMLHTIAIAHWTSFGTIVHWQRETSIRLLLGLWDWSSIELGGCNDSSNTIVGQRDDKFNTMICFMQDYG